MEVRFVKISKFYELTGYTEKAQERKRQEGVWVEGREYRRAPDGNILMDLEGYEKWVLQQNTKASKSTANS